MGLLALFVLSGCGPRDFRYSPKHLSLTGFVVPAEIEPVSASNGDAAVGGIYPAEADDEKSLICCWAAPKVTAKVEKKRAATRLSVSLYLPDIAPFKDRPQSITVSFPGARFVKVIRNLTPGFHSLSVPVPSHLLHTAKYLPVDLRADLSFVPPESTAGNPRRYSYILTGIYYR